MRVQVRRRVIAVPLGALRTGSGAREWLLYFPDVGCDRRRRHETPGRRARLVSSGATSGTRMSSRSRHVANNSGMDRTGNSATVCASVCPWIRPTRSPSATV